MRRLRSNFLDPLARLVVSGILPDVLLARAAENASPPSPPPFKQLRYDETYTYLRDPALRSDFLDRIKFIPLNADGDWYLTLGGEIRLRYEYFNNASWGRGPQDDDGYLLQRYMIHADAHFGNIFASSPNLKVVWKMAAPADPGPPIGTSSI